MIDGCGQDSPFPLASDFALSILETGGHALDELKKKVYSTDTGGKGGEEFAPLLPFGSKGFSVAIYVVFLMASRSSSYVD